MIPDNEYNYSSQEQNAPKRRMDRYKAKIVVKRVFSLLFEMVKHRKEHYIILGIISLIITIMLVLQWKVFNGFTQNFGESLIPNVLIDMLSIVFTGYLVTYLNNKNVEKRDKGILFGIIAVDFYPLIYKLIMNYLFLIFRDAKHLGHHFIDEEKEIREQLRAIAMEKFDYDKVHEPFVIDLFSLAQTLEISFMHTYLKGNEYREKMNKGEDLSSFAHLIVEAMKHKNWSQEEAAFRIDPHTFFTQYREFFITELDEFYTKHQYVVPMNMKMAFSLIDMYLREHIPNHFNCVKNGQIDCTDFEVEEQFKSYINQVTMQFIHLLNYFKELEPPKKLK